MPPVVPNSGDPPVSSPNSPQLPAMPPVGEPRLSEPDRVVAYLRSAIKEAAESQSKSKPRLLGFLRRKPLTETVAMPQVTPEPTVPVQARSEFPAPASESAVSVSSAAHQSEPTTKPPASAIHLETPRTTSPEPSVAESVQPDARFADPVHAEEPALESPVTGPAPVETASCETPQTDAPPRSPALRGEVLPPETSHPSSPEPARAAGSARIITMQPGLRGTPEEPPPPRRA
jgi:hypothetical protein